MRARTSGLLVVLSMTLGSSELLGQNVLREFSYDELRPTALQVDLGLLGASRLRSAVTGGVRLDFGRIAPRVRLLLGISYYRSHFSNEEIDAFESRIRQLVDDPDDNFTVDVGSIQWADLTGDLDLQYVLPQGDAVTAYFGLGLSLHVRNGTGAAIEETFLEDALDDVAAGLNGTFGLELAAGPRWRFVFDARGVLLSNHATASVRGGVAYRLRPDR